MKKRRIHAGAVLLVPAALLALSMFMTGLFNLETGRQSEGKRQLEDAVRRARTVAAPINNQRFGNDNPCSATGTCGNCKNEKCICNQIVITRHCRPVGRIKFILVGEELGF